MKLSFKEKVGYGLGDTASNFVWATMSTFLFFYYTNIFGIDPAAAGIMMLVTRVFDGLADFAMGAIADRTNTRWGKFRPYLFWMSIPLGISFILTFTPTHFDPNGKLIYAYFTYNLLMLLYTAINIPYGALSGVMTDDPLERTSLSSYRMVLAQCGGILVSASIFVLAEKLGDGDAALGYQRTVILFSIAAVVLFFITFWTTRERIHPPPKQHTNLLQDLKTLFFNPHWLVMFVTALVNMTFIIVRASNVVFYCFYHLHFDAVQIGIFNVAGSLCFIGGAMCTRFVVKALGKKYAFIVSMLGTAVGSALFYLIAPDQPVLLYAVQFIVSAASGVNASLFFAMLGDIADFSEWKFKTRNTGIVFSATTCSQKVGMGIAGALAGAVLSYYGYVKKEDSPPAKPVPLQADVLDKTPVLPVPPPVVKNSEPTEKDKDNAAEPTVATDSGAEKKPIDLAAAFGKKKVTDDLLPQSAHAVEGVILLGSLIPAAGFLFLTFFFLSYGLNEDFLHEIRAELNRRRLAEGEEATL